MGKLLKTIRGCVYPRPSIESKLQTGELRASNAILGMLGVIVLILLVAHLIVVFTGT